METEDNESVRKRTMERLTWILIYVGVLLIGLGLYAARTDGPLGIGIAVAGLVLAAAGISLIGIRSRKDAP